MPYTISYFGLTTADLNRLRQASARFILKRHWLEAEILPHVLRYFGIATLVDPAVSATIAATGLYLREGNPVDDLGYQNGREECGNARQKSVVLALMDLWSPYVGLCRDQLRFTAAFFTKTRVVKLRLRSPLSGITTVSLGCSGFNFLLTPLSLVSHAHTLFCPPFFPPRHLVTSIYSMAHGAVIETFPVASRYRYIPNTLGRKRLR